MSRVLAGLSIAALVCACGLLSACSSCCPEPCDPCARPPAAPAAVPPVPQPAAPVAVVPAAPKTPKARWPDVDCGGGVTGRAILEELKTVASAKGWDDVVYEISWWTAQCWQDDGPCCREVQRALDAAKAGDHAACRAAIDHPVH